MLERGGKRVSARGERLYGEFNQRVAAGEELAFEGFCAEHPELEDELRELHAFAARIDDLLPAGSSARFEPSADRDADERFASELLTRLAGRPQAFRRYETQREIARGSQGTVVRVWDVDLRRPLAMKVLEDRTDAGGEREPRLSDSRALGRFLEEAQVTGQLDHPGIVPVHELGLDEQGRVYFTMKLVRGRTLREVLELVERGEEGWSQVRALGVLLKVCEAMAYAHHKGVVHRDLKPANVMVGRFGEVYVMDWGLAKVLGQRDARDLRVLEATSEFATERRELADSDPDSPLVTMDGDVIGTPAYMPPEQALGWMDEVGPHSDVYAVGAMLYHLLAGHMPYVPRGSRAGSRAVWRRVREGAPPALRSLREDLPPELVAVCERAMERDLDERYPSMAELADDLGAYLEGRVVRAYERGNWAEVRKWIRRNRALAAALACAIALPSAGFAASLWYKAKAERNAAAAAAESERAKRNEGLAEANAEAAALNAKRAKEQGELAQRRAQDVFALSATKDFSDLVERADELWPPTPELVAEYEAWSEEARSLVEGRPADPARGVEARPGIAEHRTKLAELRALPSVEVARPRASSARERHLAELERLRLERTWSARMLGREPWPEESTSAADTGIVPNSASVAELDRIVDAWVGPGSTERGREQLALSVARGALERASAPERARTRTGLAWALFRCGRLEEASQEGAGALDELRAEEILPSLTALERAVADWSDRPAREVDLVRIDAELRELEFRTGERRPSDREDAWWQSQLTELVEGLERLADPEDELAGHGIDAEHGWGIARRLEFARTIEERSITGELARARWEEAIEGIRTSPAYGGLSIRPQMGLFPLGMDPGSGLYEFAHLQSGEPAVRAEDGRLQVGESTGIVLVLIPGGTFWMGAGTDAQRPNYDVQAAPEEGPVHEVELEPYFIAKYEMTQAQWMRITGRNPSFFQPGMTDLTSRIDLRHPVEQVSWWDCVRVLPRMDLSLPTEEQWERAARGGVGAAWWTGAELDALRGAVNLADLAAQRAQPGLTLTWSDLNDGWAGPAPVGTFPANPFGLHEVLGNVWEWCLDDWDLESYRHPRRVEPISALYGTEERSLRGGSWKNSAAFARSSSRVGQIARSLDNDVGLRPARPLRR